MLKRISNDRISVIINTKGAEIVSIINNDNFCEYIWQGNSDLWNRHAPVLFPIVGKLKNFTYKYEEKEYILMQHGFAKDLDFKISAERDDELCLMLESSNITLEYYPFKFMFQIKYRVVSNSLVAEYYVTNLNSKQMPFSIGIHPGFNCPIDNSLQFEDYFLEFEEKEDFNGVKLVDGLGTSKKCKVHRQGKKINLKHKMFEKDALVVEAPVSKRIVMKSKKDSKSITLEYPEVPYLGLWSKGTSNSYVCIEPWQGMSDFEDSNGNIEEKPGILSLLPYQVFDFKYSITVE